MIKSIYFKPLLMCTSALVISACSTGSNYTAISAPVPTNTGTASTVIQESGFIELKAIADNLAERGDHKAAIPLYRHLGAVMGDPGALNALANSLIAQGINEEAGEILATLVKREQATSGTWYNLGKVKLSVGKFDEAHSAFSYAALMSPGDPKPLSGQAISLAAMGRTSEAIAAFKTNSDTVSLSNKALIFAAIGRSKAAVALLEPIVRTGGTARDRQNLAMAYLLDGQDQQAFKMARLDLDAATTNETFTFYRSLKSLGNAERMQALITGTVKPEWTRAEYANLELKENKSSEVAAKRVIGKVQQVAAKLTPKPRENYVLTTIPPLMEPEGWALQIGAYRSIKNLMRGWTILYRQSGDLLQNVPPRRSEVTFGSNEAPPKGFYYRLNAGPLKTYKEAKTLCNALKKRKTKCWIRPPEKAEGKPQTVKTKKAVPAAKKVTPIKDRALTASIDL
ncbi:MAG: SPOR domain-containing protein [Kordiimonadaceae bacterium]|nr:SPOR domain-containing protein [Kordiimonadaceae bacterium]